MKPSTWQRKIGKRAVKHLREMGITTLRQIVSTAEHQARTIVKYPGGLEPCWPCVDIQRKLGIDRTAMVRELRRVAD